MKTVFKNFLGGAIFLFVILILAYLSGWSPLNLIFGPQYENKKVQTDFLEAYAQNLWWISEYPELIKMTDDTPSKQLKTSYRTGPEGQSNVNLKFFRSNDAIVLEVILPEQAIVSHDKENKALVPSSEPPKILIRDHDQDGVLDDFIMTPGKPPPGTSLTDDGYIKFEPKEEYQGIFVQWMVGIGYSINHFLHGIDSAYPRK